MTPTLTINTAVFQAALRDYLLTTSRTLEEATNCRLSFVLKRIYEALFPANAAAMRARIRDYLNAFILKLAVRGAKQRKRKRISQNRMPRRVYRIVESLQTKTGQPGLYGADMRKAVGKFRMKAIGSVGYLAAPFCRAWIALGVARGAIKANPKARPQKSAQATARPATATFSTEAMVSMVGAFADNQSAEVTGRYSVATQRAFDLEAEEIRRHLAKKLAADGRRAGLKVS